MFLKLKNSLKGLRNILRCNYYRLNGKLAYPNRILPKIKYVPNIDFNKLLESQEIFLVRRSDKPFIETFHLLGNTYTLKAQAIDLVRIPSLSLNLLQGKFKTHDIKFRTLGKGSDDWDGSTKIFLSEFLNCFMVLNEANASNIYFHCNSIHNIEVPYSQTANKDLNREVKKFFAAIPPVIDPASNQYNFTGCTEIKHSPTNLNYWHVEFLIRNYKKDIIKDNKIKDDKRTWQNDYCDYVFQNILSVNASPILNDNLKIIPKKAYIK